MSRKIAALYVDKFGCYAGLENVEAWNESMDARTYCDDYPVVAHPPCQRWGRYWHGSTRKPHQFKKGDDGGCFKCALFDVRRVGGVIEHPADSYAFNFFGLTRPIRYCGWLNAGDGVGHTCYIEQGNYGHISRKPTWLYAAHCELPNLNWDRCEQRIHPVALERYGYEKARRIGMCAMIGGKDKTRIRDATPIAFRDILIAIARSSTKGSK